MKAITHWQITYSLLQGVPSYVNIRASSIPGWSENWRSERDSPGKLECETYTDQVDVFIRRNNGRRVRFLTFMAA